MIDISIVIPNYNSSKWIKRCLDSILEQTYKNYEIIIVDDMSTDNSVDLIKEYEDPRIKLIELKEKRFNGGTRNVGVDNSNGRYIMFIDCDDYLVDKNVLREIYKTICNENSDLIRIGYVANKNGKFCNIRLREKNLDELANTVFVAPWTKVVKKEKFVKFPENTLLEDVVQHIAQIDNIENYAICNCCVVVWNRDNENAISSDTVKYNEESKRYSSVYRNYADLLDLKCKHDYCIKQRNFRLKNYKEIIIKDQVLGLINGVDSK